MKLKPGEIMVELKGAGQEKLVRLEKALVNIGADIKTVNYVQEQITLSATPKQIEKIMQCPLVGSVQLN